MSLTFAACLLVGCTPAENSFDVLIVNGTVYDGSLNRGRASNIGIADERIISVSAAEEAVAIGKAADIAVHISHIKALGQDVWGQSTAMVAAARESGISVTANQYPWSASGTRFSSALQLETDPLAVRPWVMTGSDGSSGHPRLFATYPKAWRDFVHDRNALSAEQFVRRSSALVADTFGLCNRGYLKPGYIADIVVLDPERFAPVASYARPMELSAGVDQLLINGTVVINNGHTSKLPGRILSGEQCD